MKIPSLRISWLMILVAFVALDFAAVRTLYEAPRQLTELIGIGALPMANVLAGCVLVAMRRPTNRHFLIGFIVGSGASLLIYLVAASQSPAALVEFLGHFFRPMGEAVRATVPAAFYVPIANCLAAACLLLYHSAIGWPVGKVPATYKIVRRTGQPPAPSTPVTGSSPGQESGLHAPRQSVD